MEIILIMLIIGIALYFITINLKRSHPKEILINDGYREVDNSFKNEMDQRLEDMKVDMYIRREAYNMYRCYIESKNMGYSVNMYITGSSYGIYTIYDENTAKYKSGNINKIIEEEYKKLIKKYE